MTWTARQGARRSKRDTVTMRSYFGVAALTHLRQPPWTRARSWRRRRLQLGLSCK